jgi:cytochrome P450
LDDKYSITQGTTLFIYTKMTALYNPGWTEARPHATSRPLDTFWAERFLTSDKGKTPRYNEAGLVGSFTSFGGGEHWCPGSQFARNVGIVTLAVLLGDFECELVGRDAVKYGVPVLNETAFGKVEPTRKVAARKVAARLRRRQR